MNKTITSDWFSGKDHLQQFKRLIKQKDLELQQPA
jgi:hypothetical protein